MVASPCLWAKFMDLIAHIWPVIAVATIGGLALQHARHAR